MRLCDGYLDEEQGENGENRRLDEADEYLEHHDGHGSHVRNEENNDQDEHFASEDIAKKPERERDNARYLGEDLNNADEESYRRLERILEKFPPIFDDADGEDARQLDDEKRQYREHEGDIEVGIDAPEERHEFPAPRMVDAERADARREFKNVGRKYKEEDGREKREKFAGHFAALEGLCDVVVHKTEYPFEKRLEASRHHPQAFADGKRENYQHRHNYPTRDESIRDGQAPQRAQLFRGEDHMNTLFHAG